MGERPLSQAELTSLVGSPEPAGGQAAGLRRFDRPAATGTPRAVPCDFRWADRLKHDQVRALVSIAESAARHFAAALSGLARTTIETRVARVDDRTYGEFVNSLQSPTCFCLVDADPLAANLALEISPAILYPLIDRLLGGVHEPGQSLRRPLTEIERRLAARVASLLLDALHRSWKMLLDIDFELARVETDPRAAPAVPPSELAIVIGFEMSAGDVRGSLQLCLPHAALEPVGGRLSDFGRAQGDMPRGIAGVAGTEGTAGGSVEIVADLAQLRMPADELAGLAVGDIITTDKATHSPLVVSVDGTPLFHARPGAYKGRKAICIEERLEPPGSR